MNKAVTFPENTPTSEEFSTFLQKYVLAGYYTHKKYMGWI